MSWSQLPPELLYQVFLHAYPPAPLQSFNLADERQWDLLSLFVNRAWSQVARDELYRHVCLESKKYGESLLETFQCEGGEELRGVVRSIRVRNYMRTSPLDKLLLACPQLEALSLTMCRHITPETLQSSSLRTLHLRHTVLDGDNGPTRKGIISQFSPGALPQLQRLVLQTVNERDLATLLLLSAHACPSVRELLLLDTHDSYESYGDQDVARKALANPRASLAPQLHSIVLEPEPGAVRGDGRDRERIPNMVWPFLLECTSLTTLVLSHRLYSHTQNVIHLPPSLVALSTPSIVVALHAALHLPNLKFLEVSLEPEAFASAELQLACETRGIELAQTPLESWVREEKGYSSAVHDALVAKVALPVAPASDD